jgi:hypothetical protein
MSTDPHANPYKHPACLDDRTLLSQCSVERGRSGGPGGQNRNKVETLVELTHGPTGVSAHAGERRSQEENKRVALKRLRLALAVHVRMPVPMGDVGSDLWKSRRRGPREDANRGSPPKSRWSAGGQGVLEVNPDHHDYPCLLAEALDVISASNWDPKPASLRLEVSASQLVKLIKEHPAALAMWNAEREKQGMRALK